MAGGLVAIGAAQIGLGIYEGKKREEAAEATAESTRLAAEADVERINAELEDALDMQQVLFAGQGRVVEGSALAVMEGDKAAAERDIKAVRAGAGRTSEALRTAGRVARFSATAGGLLSGAGSFARASQIG